MPQQKDQVSRGAYVIQFAIVIACPGWYPDSDALSRVVPWDRSEMVSQLAEGIGEIQRPGARLADAAASVSGTKKARLPRNFSTSAWHCSGFEQ